MSRASDRVAPAPADLALATDGKASAERRIKACLDLIQAGYFEEVEAPLAQLELDPAVAGEARRLLKVSRQIRRWGIVGRLERYDVNAGARATGGPAFGRETCVFIARRPGASKIVFVFPGLVRFFWMSVHLLNEAMPDDAHIVYLRETREQFYLSGVEGLGPDYESAVAALRDLAGQLGASEIYCLGASAGGYAAMKYGLDLGAVAVLAMAPAFVGRRSVMRAYRRDGWLLSFTRALLARPQLIVEKTGRFAKEPRRYAGDIAKALTRRRIPPLSIVSDAKDLRSVFREHPHRTRVMLVYGENNKVDAENCIHLAELDGVTLHPVPGTDRHDMVAETIGNGQFRALVEGLLLASPAAAGRSFTARS